MTRAFVLAFVVACGSGGKKPDTSNTGGDTPSSTATATTGDGVYGGAAYGGYRRTAELSAFHAAIATKATLGAACPASAQLHDAASALAASAPPPGTNPEMWSGEANELLAISEDLITNCNATDVGAQQFDLDSMHRSFQRLLLLVK
jgi:hypothetical protein